MTDDTTGKPQEGRRRTPSDVPGPSGTRTPSEPGTPPRTVTPSGTRRSYSDEPGLVEDVFDLLDRVFPGIRATAARAKGLDASWESVSTPYVLLEEGRVVAHVGVIELPLVLAGKEVAVGSVHAVATDPERRRRGLFRRLLDTVLEDCRGRYPTLLLTTENPEYYEPFGFRVVPEHEFRIRFSEDRDALVGEPAPLGSTSAGWDSPCPAMRPLDLSRGSDVETLHRLLERRAPVSVVCGVVRERAVFCFNEAKGPLWYASDLDAVCVTGLTGSESLALYDVVAEEIPSLFEILVRLPGAQRRREVVVHFSPDQLGVGYDAPGDANRGPAPATRRTEPRAGPPQVLPVARTFDHQGPSYLMAQGNLLAPGVPFSLPRSART